MENTMHIDMQRIEAMHRRMLTLKGRADDVIAHSQKRTGPFEKLTDGNRLYCAFLAHQAKEQLNPAATKLGLKLEETYEDGIEDAVTAYFTSAGKFLGTSDLMVYAGYVDAVDFLLDHADAILQRAEEVLVGARTQDGQNPLIIEKLC